MKKTAWPKKDACYLNRKQTLPRKQSTNGLKLVETERKNFRDHNGELHHGIATASTLPTPEMRRCHRKNQSKGPQLAIEKVRYLQKESSVVFPAVGIRSSIAYQADGKYQTTNVFLRPLAGSDKTSNRNDKVIVIPITQEIFKVLL